MTTRLNRTTRDALAEAIEADHPCDDYGCDIAVALREGFVVASALLLTGATETPNVNRVTERYGIDLGDYRGAAFEKWAAWHRKYGRECPSCESFMYADPDTGFEPGRCTDCLASMPADSLVNGTE